MQHANGMLPQGRQFSHRRVGVQLCKLVLHEWAAAVVAALING